MEQLVIVRADGSGQFTAQALSVPEIKATAATEQAAVEQVRLALAAWLGRGKVVRIEVPVGGTGNPWIDFFGSSADDPDYDEYLEEIRKFRESQDAP